MKLFRRRSKAAAQAPVPASMEAQAPPAAVGGGPKPINLALQGGGAHGAFEWGVIDRLLEDGRLEIRAITAASAGAMNAVALAAGMAEDGARGGRARLESFWRAVNQAGGRNVFGDSAIWTAAFNPRWLQANPFYRYFETLLLSASPYEFNPFNLNPLRAVLSANVDFAKVRAAPFEIFISATDVLAGKERIFAKSEIDAETVLASCALPHLFHAVTIEGRPYWDGGYLANPALWPLFYADTPRDILIVMCNAFRRKEAPTTAGEIVDRLNEITFNASLSSELRAVAFVQRLIEEGVLQEADKGGRYRHMLIHAIEADGRLDDLPLSSKFDTEWNTLLDLKARGRKAASAWLDHCFDCVGERSSIDIKATFL